MPVTALSPLQRLVLAFYAFFAILFRADVAVAFHRLREARRAGTLPAPDEGAASPARPQAAAPPAPAPASTAAPAAAPPKPAPKPAPPPASAPTPPGPTPATAPPGPAAAPAAAPRSATAPSPAPAPAPAAAPAAAPVAAAPAPVSAAAPATPDPRPALQLLALLQREGRLVDFIEEDLTGFPDSAIGAAARTVHAGCRKALAELFDLEPVLPQAEGASVTVERAFDPAAIRLTGNVVGEPPFRGALRHHGWRARKVKIPPPPGGADPAIVAPAEVEL